MADDVTSNRAQSVRSYKKDARNSAENLVRKKASKDQAKPRKRASKASNEASKYGGPDPGMASLWQPVKGGSVRNKPTKGVKSAPVKKTGGVSMMAGPSVMGKIPGGVSMMKAPQVRKGTTKNVKMEAALVAPSSDSKKGEDPRMTRDPAFNYGPVRYDSSKMDEEFKAIMEENLKTTLLSVSVHIARFVIVDGNRACFHVVLQNKTDQHVVFSVVRPPHSRLSVSPKVGFLAPAGHTQIFLMFSCRVQRFPDDLAFVYSIFQQAVAAEDVPLLEDDKNRFSTRNTRQVLKKKPSTHVWHIGVAFGEKQTRGRASNCDGRLHHMGRSPELNADGKIAKEAPYNPDAQDDRDENLPSAEE